jgi:large subunit ribosomal protein L25
VELNCLARAIPEELVVDLTGAMLGDSIHISAVTLPEGVRPTIRRDFTIATIAGRMAEIAETEAPAAAEVPTVDEVEGEAETE